MTESSTPSADPSLGRRRERAQPIIDARELSRDGAIGSPDVLCTGLAPRTILWAANR